MARFCPALALVASLCALPAAPSSPRDGPQVEERPRVAGGAALKGKVDTLLNGPDYTHASWGVLAVDAKTGETVYARNPDTLLAPASVTKLFTCAAALVAIGPEHKSETRVYQRGLAVKGTLRGDLILVAGGDLLLGGRTKDGKTVFKDKDHTYANSGLVDSELTDTDPLAGLDDLAKQVKAAGITTVDGDVLIDDRLFARARATGSGPEVVTPLIVNDNCLDLLVTPGEKEGDSARVVMRPETSFVTLDAVVTTGPADGKPTLQLLAVGPTQFALRGAVPAGGKPQVRIYPVEDPILFARALFVEALRRNGVRAQSAVLRPGGAALPPKGDYEKLPKVATLTSAPFKDTVLVTLKVSHNLYASALPGLVAASDGKTTLEAGLKRQGEILKELGVDLRAISFGGGAGGAPADHVSARATVQLLQGMRKRPEWDAYKAALPVLGVDGTLSEAVGADSPAKGQAFAKTGTLAWYDAVNERTLLKSKALAGVVVTKGGRELLFCAMVNNVPLPPGVGPTREGKALGKLCELLHEHGP